ncbi:MAG: MFS transporter [Proteobacteria bacterium]|nr:MFS transporter [Pseudomonadota bacterium]
MSEGAAASVHWRILPPGITADAAWIIAGRGVRAFADGFVALLLPIYLVELGFDAFAVGTIVTGTLLGSAVLTMAVGLIANRVSRRRLLLAGCLLMILTGAGLGVASDYWPILLVAVVGTANPGAGDAGIFPPLEQTMLTQSVDGKSRTALFARYSLVGTLVGALGALAAAIPDFLVAEGVLGYLGSIRAMFWLYGAFGVLAALCYRPLSAAVETDTAAPAAPLGRSRGIVFKLAALFSLDSLGSGLFVQSLLALWLYQRFGLSISATANILFWTSVCSAVSYLLAVPLSERIGLIRTMVFTHLPSNVLLMLVPVAPNLPIAVGLLVLRSLLSQMDVPTRASYVMAVVTPAERPAAASVTSVPRTITGALSPSLAGYLMTLSGFGWSLILAGLIKSIYDLLLLYGFQHLRPPEEQPQPIQNRPGK